MANALLGRGQNSVYLNESTLSKARSLGGINSGEVMTSSGAITKTAYLTLVVALGALIPSFMEISPNLLFTLSGVCGLAAVIMVLVMVFKVDAAKYIAFPYAICEGLAISALVFACNSLVPGVATEALFATLALLGGVTVAYKTGLIKVNETFKTVFTVMSFAFLGLLVINLVTMFFFKDFGNTLFALSNASWIAIGITLFMLIYGSFCLVLDLQMIENGEAEQLNKDFEWYCAVSLLITVVFIYVQMLRLLVQIYLRASDN